MSDSKVLLTHDALHSTVKCGDLVMLVGSYPDTEEYGHTGVVTHIDPETKEDMIITFGFGTAKTFSKGYAPADVILVASAIWAHRREHGGL